MCLAAWEPLLGAARIGQRLVDGEHTVLPTESGTIILQISLVLDLPVELKMQTTSQSVRVAACLQ